MLLIKNSDIFRCHCPFGNVKKTNEKSTTKKIGKMFTFYRVQCKTNNVNLFSCCHLVVGFVLKKTSNTEHNVGFICQDCDLSQ